MELIQLPGKIFIQQEVLTGWHLHNLIFNNNSLLEKVNSLVHPVVFDHFRKWELNRLLHMLLWKPQYFLKAERSKLVDRIATVVAPVEERMEQGYPKKQAFQGTGYGKNEESDG